MKSNRQTPIRKTVSRSWSTVLGRPFRIGGATFFALHQPRERIDIDQVRG
jgi:hypothetical protein